MAATSEHTNEPRAKEDRAKEARGKEAPVQAPESRFWEGSPALLCAVVGAHVLWLAATPAGKGGGTGSSGFYFLAAVVCHIRAVVVRRGAPRLSHPELGRS